jgi:peptidyl-prolyl cis-trans isomerase C
MNGYNVIKAGTVWWVVPLLFFFFSPLSCDKAQPLKEKELARINDRVITLEEFEQEMEQLPFYLKTLMVAEKGKKEFLQNLIERELLLQEGVKKGFDKDEKVLAKVEKFRQGLIIDFLMEEHYAGRDEVGDDEIQAYYQENKDKFLLGERVRVRHIMVKTYEEAKEIKKRLYQGEDFIALATQKSIWPYTKQWGGDLGYIERGTVEDKSFEQAAFALKKRGELSDIVKTKRGYHIIRLEDREKPRQRIFSEVQEEIRNRLRNKKREEILAAHLQALRKEAQIIINEELLSSEEEEGS